MEAILTKTTIPQENNNPQSVKIVQRQRNKAQYYENVAVSSQCSGQNLNNESQIQRSNLSNWRKERGFSYQENQYADQFQSLSSKASISEDCKLAQFMQHSRLKKREDNSQNQILELRKTRNIQKSNQDYRNKILAAQKEKTQISVENIVLSKQIQLLEAERNTWEIKRQYCQDLQQLQNRKDEKNKQFYTKTIKRLEKEVEQLSNQLELQKKRQAELQAYNKSLFEQLAIGKEAFKQEIKKLNEKQAELLKKVQKQTQQITFLNEQKHRGIQKVCIANENVCILKRNESQLSNKLKEVQLDRNEIKTRLYILQRENQQFHHHNKTSLQEFDRNLAYLNQKIAEQKQINSLKDIQIAKYEQSMIAFQMLKQQNTLLKQNMAQLQLSNRTLSFRLAEVEHNNRQKQMLIRQQQINRRNIQLELKRYKKQSNDTYKQLLRSNQGQIQSQKLQAQHKLQRLTNDLLNERSKNDLISHHLAISQQQLAALRTKFQAQIQLNEQKNHQIQHLQQKIKDHEILHIQNTATTLEKQFIAKKTQKDLQQTIEKYKRQAIQSKSRILSLQNEMRDEKDKYQKQKQSLNELFKDMNFSQNEAEQVQKDQSQKIKGDQVENHEQYRGQRKQEQKKQQDKNNQLLRHEQQADKANKMEQSQQMKDKLNKLGHKQMEEKLQSNYGQQRNITRLDASKEAIIGPTSAQQNNGMQKLNNLIMQLKKHNQLIQNENRKLQFQNGALLAQLQSCKSILREKEDQNQQLLNNIDQICQGSSSKIQNLQAELLMLRKNNQQLRERYLIMQKEFKKCKLNLQQQLQMYRRDKNFKVIQNIRNLLNEISKAQKVMSELVHPPVNSIKKFINLMNTTHRQNLGRQIQKIVQYYSRIQQTKTAAQRHYDTMKIILISIAPVSYINSERNSPKK